MLPDVKFHDLSFILNDKGSLEHCQFIFTFALRVFKRMVSQVLSEYQQKARYKKRWLLLHRLNQLIYIMFPRNTEFYQKGFEDFK